MLYSLFWVIPQKKEYNMDNTAKVWNKKIYVNEYPFMGVSVCVYCVFKDNIYNYPSYYMWYV